MYIGIYIDVTLPCYLTLGTGTANLGDRHCCQPWRPVFPTLETGHTSYTVIILTTINFNIYMYIGIYIDVTLPCYLTLGTGTANLGDRHCCQPWRPVFPTLETGIL